MRIVVPSESPSIVQCNVRSELRCLGWRLNRESIESNGNNIES